MKAFINLVTVGFGIIIYSSLLAQDIDIDLVDDTPSIFENPVFWIGVAVVLIVISFILRKKK